MTEQTFGILSKVYLHYRFIRHQQTIQFSLVFIYIFQTFSL